MLPYQEVLRPRIIPNLGAIERFKLQAQGFLHIVDHPKDTLAAVEKYGFGFIRAELPPKFRYNDPDNGHEYPNSRKVMLRVDQVTNNLRLSIIPGMHDVNGYTNYGNSHDPFHNFRLILKSGFRGGPTMNTYLTVQEPTFLFPRVGYRDNTARETTVSSHLPDTSGDRYRLLLWSGFTSNYSHDSELEGHVNIYGYGTVAHTPVERIQPYIIVTNPSQEQTRVQYYRNHFEGFHFPQPIRVLNFQYRPIAEIDTT